MHALKTTLGYSFRDPALLELALTHPSLGKANNNQRLEFLGDSILGAVVAHMLYRLFPAEQEGELARRQAALVRGETLCKVARKLELGKYLRMAGSEAAGGGRETASNLEDAMEALIGAVFLDGGYGEAQNFIEREWAELAKTVSTTAKDAKTALQEWAQARGLPVPAYRLLEHSGPAHAPVFTVEVSLPGHKPQQANANAKRAAEQLAAQKMLEALGE